MSQISSGDPDVQDIELKEDSSDDQLETSEVQKTLQETIKGKIG